MMITGAYDRVWNWFLGSIVVVPMLVIGATVFITLYLVETPREKFERCLTEYEEQEIEMDKTYWVWGCTQGDW